ncbi:MAG: hypothetical protein DMF69_22580 [Acidobacteria bacterium]|nr:MAG: hypothetical protein DMF69_22580 [Acidobacteriota bacterium]
MKSPWMIRLLLFITVLIAVPAVYGQAEATQEKTRQRLSALLERVGPDIKVEFKPSSKSQFVFAGMMREGLANAESLEIIVTVTEDQTIRFRVFPKYKGGYINIDKAKNSPALLRKLVQLNSSTFLFWGADNDGDIFTGYTFTLESGFPDEALKIVLSSIKNSDKFVGEMKPSIDGAGTP